MTDANHWTPEELALLESAVRDVVDALVFDRATRDDIVQDSFLVAMRRGRSGIRDPLAFLRQVARRRALRIGRLNDQRRDRETITAKPERADFEDADERVEVLSRVRSLVAELAEPYRTVVELRYFEQLPPEAIATQLQRPLNTVKSQLARGLERMRMRLDAEHGGSRAAWVAVFVRSLRLRREQRAVAGASAPLAVLALWRWWIAGALACVVAGVWVLQRASSRPELAIASRPDADGSRSAAPLGGPSAADDRRGVTEREPPATRSEATESPANEGSPPDGGELGAVDVEVRDELGLPMRDVAVAIVRGLAVEERARTDAQGWARVSYFATDVGGSGFAGTEDRVALLARSATHGESRLHLPRVRDGAAPSVAISYPSAPVAIRGRVVDAAGVPVADASVISVAFRAPPTDLSTDVARIAHEPRAITGADGSFELIHRAGDARFRIESSAHPISTHHVQIPEGAHVHDVLLRVARAATVEGVVTDREGRPAPGIEIGLASLYAQRDSVPLLHPPRSGEPVVAVVTGAAGEYSLRMLPPGELVLLARSRSDPASCARLQTRARPGERIAWNPVLDRRAGVHIELRRSDGSPCAGWFVQWKSSPGSPLWRESSWTDAAGRASIYGPPRTPIRAHVTPSNTHVGFPRAYLTDLVESEEAIEHTVADASQHASAIRGSIADDRGLAIPELELWVELEEHDYRRPFPVFDDGRFELSNLPSGTYRLSISTPGRGIAELALVVVAPESTLELGRLQAPVPVELAVDWSRTSTPEALHTFSLAWRGASSTRAGEYFVIQAGACPPASTYRLYPGLYSVRVLRDGIVVAVRNADLVAGDARIEIGDFERQWVRWRCELAPGVASPSRLELTLSRTWPQSAAVAVWSHVSEELEGWMPAVPGVYRLDVRGDQGSSGVARLRLDPYAFTTTVVVPLR